MAKDTIRGQSDTDQLHQLGYAQELKRGMGAFSNFAVSFTIISILSGCLTLFGFGMVVGGPASSAYGWPLVGINTGVLVAHGLLNTFGIRLVALFNDVSVWWHMIGVAIIVAIVIAVPDHHTSLGTIFSFSKTAKEAGGIPGFINGTGFASGFFGSTLYIFLIGLLLAQYTITGYDASAHMTEETHQANISGPNGIWKSVVYSVIFGWILLIAVWAAVQGQKGYDNALGFQLATANIAAPAQIFLDAVGRGTTIFLMLIIMGAQFFCGMASVTANSRMIYAFSRDGAVPGSKFWHKINKRTRTPTNSIWLAVVAAWLLVAPAYWKGSVVAYFAVTSIAVIGLYIAYVIPTFLRLLAGNKFQPGPWNLGRWSYLVGWIAVIWVVFICIMLMMPQFSPGGLNIKTIDALNYAPVAVGAVLVLAGGWYVISAHKWFKGAKVQGSAEELAAIERDLEVIA